MEAGKENGDTELVTDDEEPKNAGVDAGRTVPSWPAGALGFPNKVGEDETKGGRIAGVAEETTGVRTGVMVTGRVAAAKMSSSEIGVALMLPNDDKSGGVFILLLEG